MESRGILTEVSLRAIFCIFSLGLETSQTALEFYWEMSSVGS